MTLLSLSIQRDCLNNNGRQIDYNTFCKSFRREWIQLHCYNFESSQTRCRWRVRLLETVPTAVSIKLPNCAECWQGDCFRLQRVIPIHDIVLKNIQKFIVCKRNGQFKDYLLSVHPIEMSTICMVSVQSKAWNNNPFSLVPLPPPVIKMYQHIFQYNLNMKLFSIAFRQQCWDLFLLACTIDQFLTLNCLLMPK